MQSGKLLFEEIGCASCHLPTLTTGYSNIVPLSEKVINPYTDLLLHDMGTGLDDGFIEASEQSSEWRTPPLWGIGLSADSQGGAVHLMHDGRAKSLEEAIMIHGGEAEFSKTAFEQLSTDEKDQIIRFLESL